MYSFQSKDRNADLGNRVRFHNFSFDTDDKETAEFVRRNCIANPAFYWELGLISEKQDSVEPVEKPKRGRPKGLEVRQGMRTNPQI